MKLDPSLHIGLHLVFFGKTGVTKPYIQFFSLYCWRGEITWSWCRWSAGCPQEDTLSRLILGDRQGRWTEVQVGYNRETYL
jgi:hypothetical protein